MTARLFIILAAFQAGLWPFLSFFADNNEPTYHALTIFGLLSVGLFAFLLTRISVPVTNLVLDPSRKTAPYRPHPGRVNLATGLVLVATIGMITGLSPTVNGFLLIAAGAAFMDRISESFIGCEAFHTEMILLTLPSLLAGLGLMGAGAASLGAPLCPAAFLGMAFMGGAGIAAFALLALSQSRQAGEVFSFPGMHRISLFLIVAASILPTLLDPGTTEELSGLLLSFFAALFWTAGFLVWFFTPTTIHTIRSTL